MRQAFKLSRAVAEYVVASQLSLLGLAETRWGGAGRRRVKHATGNLYIYYSGNERKQYGVGIVMTQTMASYLIDWEPVSERIITATFQYRNRKVTVVQVYAPTKPTNEAKCERCRKFYDELKDVLNKLKAKHNPDSFVVMGDFNAGVGPNNKGFERHMGVHALDETKYMKGKKLSLNTKLLLGLCKQFELCVGGSLFENDDAHKYTWEHPRWKYKHQIDHILVSISMKNRLVDVKNYSLNLETLQPIDERQYQKSDHKPIVATFLINDENKSIDRKRKIHFDDTVISYKNSKL